ncbi:heat shock 70 kDa protein 12A-like isoform X1 [Mytilus galloprovincialis]|uniref:heat shock 70 kDa protein 12A-like isoform X1 n=1 Tax=Mytilus galloprovincialis TaxID=29158 RepID=UPI003F7BDF3A
MSKHTSKKDEKEKVSEAIDAAKLFVAAIDFGTTYSGYAFSAKSTPNDIFTCSWQKSTLVSMKAPTSVLLDKENNFVAFGFDAETKYLESLENEDSDSDDEDSGHKDEFHYFNRFKMMLHNQTVNLDTTIKDQNGMHMKAFDIFSFAIKYLKDQAIGRLVKTLKNVETNDIHYVLTVPAIWDDQAKIFMRKAAEKAGIKGKDLTIALEPETASIYCQELRTNRDGKSNKTFSETIKKGTKYVVVDLGGGTADITVHERLLDDSLEEVLPPSGGNWGGTAIDKAYKRFLYSVFTKKVIKELKSDELEDYTTLCHEFEVKKRSITSGLKTDIVITLPYSLVEITVKHCKTVQSAIMQSSYKESVSFSTPQKLFVNPEVFRNLFNPTIDALIKHLDKLFKDPNLSDLHHIIMVGGFSECELVQTAMRKTFPNRKIIIPDEAGLAVLRGAVLFGHQPKKIGKRILRKTYGIQSWPEWDAELHPDTKKVRIDGVDRCKDVFYKFAVKGEKVEDGHSSGQIFQALKTDEKTLECTVYISDDTNPRYVTDPSCQRLGNLIVPIPPLKKGETLEIEETMIFGGTELLFRAKNMRSGDICESQFELF